MADCSFDGDADGAAEAAARHRARASFAEEVRRMAADAEDREEMRRVREQMAELGPRAGAGFARTGFWYDSRL